MEQGAERFRRDGRGAKCKGGAEQPRAEHEHEQRDADVQMCSVGAEVVVQRC